MRKALVLAAFVAAAANEPLYDYEGAASVITQLDDSNFDALVLKDETALWVVEYYADWCGHCKQFARGYTKAASNLEGLVKFGAVNADNAKKTVQGAGVQGYPSVKLYVPGSGSINPYTGKYFKPAVDYGGARSAKGVVEFATAALPDLVLPVADKGFAKFKANGTLPKAVLFSQKAEAPTLLKSLAVAFAGRMLFGQVQEEAGPKAAAELDVASFPTLVVLLANGAPAKYDGEMKPAALAAFLETHAGPPVEFKLPGAKPGAADDAESLAVDVDAASVASIVEAEPAAWILAFGAEAMEAPGLDGLAEALYGQAKVGRAAADLAPKYGVAAGASRLVVVPYGPASLKTKLDKKSGLPKLASFGVDEAGVASAKKSVLETLPDAAVMRLSQSNMDQWMQGAMMASSSKAFCILFSDKPTVPPLLRALALEFDGQMSFGMASAADAEMAKRFNVQKSPTLLAMFPDESKSDASGQVALGGMQFDPRAHGKFNFPNLAQFVAGVVQMRAQQAGAAGGAADGAGADGAPPPRREPGTKKDLGPLPELSASSYDDECTAKGGLCAIALLDGSPDNDAGREASIAMLTKLRKTKHGGPLHFSWVDATCHTGFAAAFGLSETDLPTMVVLSPSKKRWARSIGAFDAETLGAFGSGVASGRRRTDELDELPGFDSEVDCASLPRGASAYIDEEPLDMSEILAEEAREREARDAELAAEAAARGDAPAGAKVAKSTSGMSELERMEAELEECDVTDLMCHARNSKGEKAIAKKRELEEKLAAIAKKKKKAKKKAKKAAAA